MKLDAINYQKIKIRRRRLHQWVHISCTRPIECVREPQGWSFDSLFALRVWRTAISHLGNRFQSSHRRCTLTVKTTVGCTYTPTWYTVVKICTLASISPQFQPSTMCYVETVYHLVRVSGPNNFRFGRPTWTIHRFHVRHRRGSRPGGNESQCPCCHNSIPW